MLDMSSQNVEQLGQKGNTIVELSRPVETPVEELNERRESIGLKHIIPVFFETTEKTDDFDDMFEHTTQVFELVFVTHRDALTNFNQNWHELKLAH